MNWLEIILGVFTLFLGLYWYSRSTFDFWKSRGVKGPRPLPFLGNTKDVITRKKSFYQVTKEFYDNQKDQSMIGLYLLRSPALMICDLEIVKDILVRDFTVFPDRGWKFFPKIEPLSQHLINLDVDRWRPLRPRLSPAFASGKLKNMFSLLLECGREFEEYMDKLIAVDEEIDCHEISATFLTEIVGGFFFGLKMNAMADENSEFRILGRNVFIPNWKRVLQFRVRQHMPWLYNILGSLLATPKTDNFFSKVMKDIIDHRKNNNIVKHDFIDLVSDLQDHPDKVPDYELTESLIMAQLYVFFLAGFETSAVSMAHVLYEIAQNHTIQDKLRDEINSQLAKNNGEMTYEGLNSMKYLDMVLQESLRKYPPVAILQRTSAEDYTFSNGVAIPKGTRIIIPAFAIQRDPRNFPQPDVFDPERFTEEAVKGRHLMTDLAFGQGPRICIARRYATYQSKFGLFKIIQRYNLQICKKTKIPFAIEPTNILLSMKDGPYIKFTKIDKI